MLEQEFYNAIIQDKRLSPLKNKPYIYYNNILQGRINALKDIFSAVSACLGDSYIQHIALDFCQKYDAPHGNLNLYGQEFGAYLAQLPACAPYPYIRDLADFEYMIQKILYMEDEAHISPQEFALCLQDTHKTLWLARSNIVFSSFYKISDIMDYCLGRQEDIPDTTHNSQLNHYFIYRDPISLKNFVKSITPSQVEIIPTLRTQHIGNIEPEKISAPDIQEFLQFLIQSQLLVVGNA